MRFGRVEEVESVKKLRIASFRSFVTLESSALHSASVFDFSVLQSVLWRFQSVFWQVLEQYPDPQREHFKSPGCEQLGKQHVWLAVFAMLKL